MANTLSDCDRKMAKIIVEEHNLMGAIKRIHPSNEIDATRLSTVVWANSLIFRHYSLKNLKEIVRDGYAIAISGLFCEDDTITHDAIYGLLHISTIASDEDCAWMIEQDGLIQRLIDILRHDKGTN